MVFMGEDAIYASQPLSLHLSLVSLPPPPSLLPSLSPSVGAAVQAKAITRSALCCCHSLIPAGHYTPIVHQSTFFTPYLLLLVVLPSLANQPLP